MSVQHNLRHIVRRCTCAPHYRKTFFTLPSLSSLSPFSGPGGQEPQTYHERKIFPYHAQQLYDVVADVASYPQFIPFCTKSQIMNKTRHGDSLTSPMSMDAELTVGFLSMKESYVSRVTCTPYLAVEAAALSSTPLFKTLLTTWRFQPASPGSPHTTGYLPRQDSWSNSETQAMPVGVHSAGSTLVTLDLAFAFSNPVHATVSATFFGQVSKLMVKAFEERCVEVYGPGNK